MKLFVLGGSGGVGRHVLTLARERGHEVTALVRASSKDAVAGANVVVGDVLEDALDAMAGHDAVVSSLGIKRVAGNPWSALTSPPDFCSRSAQRIVAAMKRTGVARVIAVSAAGVAESAPAMNLLMKVLVKTSNVGVAYRDLAVMEAVYRDASVEWLCPRPTRLTNGPLTSKGRVTSAFPSTAAISRADVAAWMLDALTVVDWRATWPTRTPQITTT